MLVKMKTKCSNITDDVDGTISDGRHYTVNIHSLGDKIQIQREHDKKNLNTLKNTEKL